MRRHRESIWTKAAVSMAAAVSCGLLCTMAALLLSAAVIFYVLKDIGTAGGFAAVSLAAGAYTGAFIYGKYRRKRGLLCGMLCGAVMFGVIAACTFAVIGDIPGIKKLLLLTVSGAAGGVAGVNSKRPKGLMDQ